MPNQTIMNEESYSDGVRMDISTDSGSSWSDCGILADGYTWVYQYSTGDMEHGNAENPAPLAKNLKVTIQPSALRSWDTSILEDLMGGLLSRTTTAGALVEGAEQVVASGDWEFNKGILLSGQNAAGTVPTINSVTGSVDGAGAADDWTTVLLPGGWYLQPLDGTNFATEAQSLTIDTDYTPAASYQIDSGTSSQVLTAIQVRFRHYTDTAFTLYDYEHVLYRVFPDAGGLTMTKLGAKSENTMDEWTIALTAECDSGLTDGSQLFQITQNA